MQCFFNEKTQKNLKKNNTFTEVKIYKHKYTVTKRCSEKCVELNKCTFLISTCIFEL